MFPVGVLIYTCSNHTPKVKAQENNGHVNDRWTDCRLQNHNDPLTVASLARGMEGDGHGSRAACHGSARGSEKIKAGF